MVLISCEALSPLPAVLQSFGARVQDLPVLMRPPLALQALEPLRLQGSVSQAVSGGGQVLQVDLVLVPAGLEEHLGGREGLRAEGDGCPGDVGIPFQEAPDQRPVPLQVLLQVLFPRLIALQDHVEEVSGVREGVQGAVQGRVRDEARLAGQTGQLVAPGAVGPPQLPRIAGVEERGHVLGHLIGEPLRQDGALRRAAPRGRGRIAALDVVVDGLPDSRRPPSAGRGSEPALGQEQEEKEPERCHVPGVLGRADTAESLKPGFAQAAAARRRPSGPRPRVTCGGTGSGGGNPARSRRGPALTEVLPSGARRGGGARARRSGGSPRAAPPPPEPRRSASFGRRCRTAPSPQGAHGSLRRRLRKAAHRHSRRLTADPYRCTASSCRPVWPPGLSVSRQPFTGQEDGAEGGGATAKRRRGTSPHLLPAERGAARRGAGRGGAGLHREPPARGTRVEGRSRAAGPRGECGSDTCRPDAEQPCGGGQRPLG